MCTKEFGGGCCLRVVFAHHWIKLTISTKAIKIKKSCCNSNKIVHVDVSSAQQSWYQAIKICVLIRFACQWWWNDWWYEKYDIMPVGSFFKHCTSEVTGFLMTSSGCGVGLLVCSTQSPYSPIQPVHQPLQMLFLMNTQELKKNKTKTLSWGKWRTISHWNPWGPMK